MKKEEKVVIIGEIAELLNKYPMYRLRIHSDIYLVVL